MIHTEHYRTTLPHQLHPNQNHLQPAFPGRFPSSNLESLNAVMLPAIGPQDHVQYPPMAAFVNSNVRLNEQHTKVTNEQRKTERPFTNEERERRDNCQDNYKSQSSENAQQQQQFTQPGQQNQQPQIQTFKQTSRKIDAATMTDPEEEEQNSNWQNVSVPTNTKVAEYLSSLRQFLKLNNPEETTTSGTNKKVKKKRQLGDVRIMTAADGTRLFCCPECHVAYPDKSLLEPHLAGHKIERRWLCGVCGAGLKRKEHLDRHQLCHSEERPYACSACPKAFKRNEHLTRHYIIHTGEKTQGRNNRKSSVFTFSLGRTKYSIQDQKYSSVHEVKYPSSIQEQKSMMSSVEKSILPPPAAPPPSVPPPVMDCSGVHTTTVPTPYGLHIPPLTSTATLPQANDKKYVCGVCGITHARREHLERHLTCHSEERPYSCRTCGKAFKRNEHLVRHAEVHSGQPSHACSYCTKAFYRKDHLAKHEAGHHAKKATAGLTPTLIQPP